MKPSTKITADIKWREKIKRHRKEIQNAITFIAQSIWTDDEFINYELYIDDKENINVITYGTENIKKAINKICHKSPKEKYLLFSYAKNITWFKDAVANTLTDKEMYEIIDSHNHNIRLITEGYSNLLTMTVFDALQLCEDTIDNYENISGLINIISTEMIKTFGDKFTKNNFERIWQTMTGL